MNLQTTLDVVSLIIKKLYRYLFYKKYSFNVFKVCTWIFLIYANFEYRVVLFKYTE